VLLLIGDPGIGKTALCGWALDHAYGMRVVTACGVESEIGIPYAALAELCAGQFDYLDYLPKPQARALEGVLARQPAGPGDQFAVGAAVLSLLSAAAQEQSVLVLVDDAQWVDRSSTDALLFAARRLREEGVAVIVAARPSGFVTGTGLPTLIVQGLDRPAARAVLHAAHGVLAAEVAQLLIDSTRGNPLALLEVPRLLSEVQLAGEQPIDEPLPLGSTLLRALLQRQSGLSDRTRRGLVVAAASRGERVQPVIDALSVAGLGRRVLDSAEEAGVLAIEAERMKFRHPLLRSAVYHGATGPARRAAHAALAEVTGGETRVWHLAQATVGEDEAVAAMLERVGLDAHRRGAPAAAASALERAARLSKPGEKRAWRLTEAARDAHLAGHSAGAMRLLDEALAVSRDPLARGNVQHLRGRILVLQGHADSAYRVLTDEAQHLRDVEPGRAAEMLADAALACIPSADIGAAVSVARAAYDLARPAGSAAQASAMSVLASALALNGQRGEAVALLDRCLPLLRAADPLGDASALVANAAQSYNWVERGDLASRLLDQLISSARTAGTPTMLSYPLAFRADLNLRLGQWALATAQAQEAVELSEEMRQDSVTAMALCFLARLAASAGDERRCRGIVARSTSLVDEHRLDLGRPYLDSALGLLELGQGGIEPAIRHLESVRAFSEQHGLAEPNIVHWQADLVEAYARAGRTDAAHELLAALDRQAQDTGGRWALGTAARCRGLLTDDSPDDCFDVAVEHLQAVPAPFEIARTHLCRGERLRRAGRRTAARRALRLAIDRFDRLGAHAWTDRARVELRASGANPRRRHSGAGHDQLTAHELQVALIVANGASNREAAAALFLSPKTIEFHLAHVYRKLGVRTRTQLAALAARRGWLGGPSTAASQDSDPPDPPPETSTSLSTGSCSRPPQAGGWAKP
jgi:DNA-binding CsgD family transcriptional regulator